MTEKLDIAASNWWSCGEIDSLPMAGTLWKSSTSLASSATLTRLNAFFLSLSLYSVQLINLSRIFVCRLKCPRITPRQLSSNVNNGPSPGTSQQKDAFQLAKSSLSSMMGYVYVWGDCWLSSKFSGIFIQNWKLVWARRLVSLGK